MIGEIINITGQVTGIPLQALPSGHQKMNGLQAAYWSGYANGIRVGAEITGLGEVVLERVDDGLLKSYAYPVGTSGAEYFMGGEFKKLPGHHVSVTAPAPFAALFGHVPWAAPILPWPGSGIAAVCSGQYPAV